MAEVVSDVVSQQIEAGHDHQLDHKQRLSEGELISSPIITESSDTEDEQATKKRERLKEGEEGSLPVSESGDSSSKSTSLSPPLLDEQSHSSLKKKRDRKANRLFSDGSNTNRKKSRTKDSNNQALNQQQTRQQCKQQLQAPQAPQIPQPLQPLQPQPQQQLMPTWIETPSDTIEKNWVHFKDGSKYYGEIVQGLIQGIGTYFTPQGDRHHGSFVNGSMVQGTITTVDGKQYVGEIKDGRFHGRGIFTGSNGQLVISGVWENGYIVEGIQKSAAGTYQGSFLKGQFHGEGQQWGVGFYCKGTFKNGRLHQGFLLKPDGTYYEGRFGCDLLEGLGKCRRPDGSTYEGEFLNGKESGTGCLTRADGTVLKGKFSNGVLHGLGESFDPKTQQQYKGAFLNGRKAGKGVLWFLSEDDTSSCIEGVWHQDRLTGKVICRGPRFTMHMEYDNAVPVGLVKIVWDDSRMMYGEFNSSGTEITGVMTLPGFNTISGTWQFPDINQGSSNMYLAKLTTVGTVTNATFRSSDLPTTIVEKPGIGDTKENSNADLKTQNVSTPRSESEKVAESKSALELEQAKEAIRLEEGIVGKAVPM